MNEVLCGNHGDGKGKFSEGRQRIARHLCAGSLPPHLTSVKIEYRDENGGRQIEEKYSKSYGATRHSAQGYWIESVSMKTASIRAEWEGQLVDGRFPLLEWLGGSDERGVFLTVLQGIQKAAIKLVPAEGAEADSYIAQWEAARKLSHPHLMAVLETGRFAFAGTDLVYVVTEFAEKSLSQTIAARALGAREVRGFLDPVLDALAYLHAKGFVHGHVKPSNLLMVADQWKLSGDDLLVAGEFPELAWIPGGYDAPEAMNGSITAAMDTWSLGMTLAEALTQHPVAWDWAAKVVPEVPEGLPRPFDEIVQECLRTDPAQRCSLEEIKARLKDAGSVAEVARPVAARNRLARMEAEPMRAMAEPSGSVAKPRWKENEPIQAEEPVQALAQPRWQDAEPEPVRPIKAEERWEPAAPPDERGPVDFDRSPTLFADIEEANLTGFSVIPWLIGGLVVLALAALFLVRTGKIPWPLWPQNAPASSQSQPQPQPPATQPGEGQGGPATGEAPPQQVQGGAADRSEGTPQAGQAAPESQQPEAGPARQKSGTAPKPQTPGSESGQSKSTPDPGNAPLTGQSAPSQPGHGRSGPQQPSPETHAADRANGEGAVADRVVPNLPEAARQSMHGPQQAVIQVFVNPDGKVSNAAYVSSGPGNYFARTAMRAAREWKFDPPIRSGHPQPSVWTLRFFFTRGNAEASAVQDRR